MAARRRARKGLGMVGVALGPPGQRGLLAPAAFRDQASIVAVPGLAGASEIFNQPLCNQSQQSESKCRVLVVQLLNLIFI